VRHPFLLFAVGMATVVLVFGGTQHAAAQPVAPAGGPLSGHPAAGGPLPGSGTATSTTGEVVETMDAGQYTYVQVDDGAKKIWAAAPKFAVAVGDKVVLPEGMAMRDFHSKTLNRTFDLVYFVNGVQVTGARTKNEQVAAAHTATAATPAAAAVDLSNVPKAEGGNTVAELHAGKTDLAGKEVLVRARVVKFTLSVMGKNWVHVQDGSGTAGTNDLTVSTTGVAAVGDTVLVRGVLTTDKDLGFGYHYDIIIEDGTVTVE